MQRIFAIAWLTWKAAFRFRLFLVLAVLLLAAVVGLPVLIKDDGTAEGFTQIILTYTLSAITGLLGLSTLWLACGTLARDIEDCQMQVVAVKPIARWQIWLGKWLGLVTLNAALLAVAGGSVYGMMEWRATKLPAAEQAKLQNEVLVARASAKERSFAADIEAETEKRLQARLTKNPVTGADLAEVKNQIREQVKAELQVVPPGVFRPWEINLGAAHESLRNQPLQLRVMFHAAQNSATGTLRALWQVGVPDSPNLWRSEVMSLAPDTFHEFEIPPNLFDKQGVLTIDFMNPNDTTVLFPLEDGMEVLYRQGGFGMNYIRGLGIILCWMALLAALGLAAASLLSFPVAAFFSLAMLTVGLSSGTLASAVANGTIGVVNEETGTTGGSALDKLAIPTFKVVLQTVNLAEGFSPVDSLSTGRRISWEIFGLAVWQIVIVLGGGIGLAGIFIFSRRELATAQGTQ